jgi:hypothetical protein
MKNTIEELVLKLDGDVAKLHRILSYHNVGAFIINPNVDEKAQKQDYNENFQKAVKHINKISNDTSKSNSR